MSTPQSFQLASGEVVCYWADIELAVVVGKMRNREIAGIDLSAAELQRLLSASSEHDATRILRSIVDQHTARYLDVAYHSLVELADQMYRDKYRQLYPGRNNRAPLKMTRQTSSALETSLCQRDEECRGQHRWVIGHESQYDIPVWHVNLDTAAIVPPTPLVFRV